MNERRLFLIGLAVFLFFALLPDHAKGEQFWDFYYGMAETEDDDVTTEFQRFSIFGAGAPSKATRKVSYGSSDLYGIRGGYWFERAPWFGMALDASFFEADGDGVDIDLIPLSGLLMFRLPLSVDGTFSKGRFQPYAGIGPTYTIADISVDFRPDLQQEVDETFANWGLDFRAGLCWLFTENIGIFVEYRYLRVDLEWDDSPGAELILFGSDEVTEVEADIETQSILGGLTFRF
jgi:opacity protein-like surface antigen